MRRGFYTIENGSMIVELVRCRYVGKDYQNWWINYWTPFMQLITTERSVALFRDKITHWIEL